MNALIKFMIIFPVFQTWLVWNGFSQVNYVEHLLHFLLGLVLISKIIRKDKLKIEPKLKTYGLLFGCFIMFGFIASLVQVHINGSLSLPGIGWEVYKLTRNVIIFLIAYWFQNKTEFFLTIKVYILIATVMSSIALFQYFFGMRFYELLKFMPSFSEYRDFYSVYVPQNRAMGLMQHPNIFGQFVAVSFFILLYFTSQKINLYHKKWIQYCLLIMSLTGVLVSSSRSTFLLCVFIPIMMAVLFKLSKVLKIYVFIFIATAPFLVFAFNQLLFKLWQYSYYTIEQGETEARLVFWGQAIEILKSNYLFGAGLGTWGDASASYSTFKPDGRIVAMSDSYLSHLLVEHGIGLVFVTILMLIISIHFFKAGRKAISNFSRSINILGLSLIIFLIFSSFNTMQLSMYENTFIIFYIFGFITSKNSLIREVKTEIVLNKKIA